MSTRHVYASVNEFKARLQNPTDSVSWTDADAQLLSVLEAVSRRVDEFCDRSLHGSGFGPRTGINYYDPSGTSVLDLDDDLLSVPTVTVDGTVFAENTDFYTEPYNTLPKRRLRCHGLTSNNLFDAIAPRTITVEGIFGYSNDPRLSSATLAEDLDDSETAVDVSDGSVLSAGQTLLCGSEQMLITALTADTATVVRGANGTTAAIHPNASALYVYAYPAEVTDATLRVAHRRWRAMQSGLTGDFGGLNTGTVSNHDSEWAILHATVGHLHIPLVY